MTRWLAPALLAAATAGVVTVAADDPKPEPFAKSPEANIYRPAKLAPTADRVARLKAPDGFKVTKFAEGLKNPRMLAVDDLGTVYATLRDEGKVVAFRDDDRDGKADRSVDVTSGLKDVHGITVKGRKLYLCTPKELYVCDLTTDPAGKPEKLVGDLPDGAQHPNRTIAFGPDGKLYISVGSSCNACDETNPEHATILRAEPDGSARKVFARGLRNTVGFGWHPTTNEMWGMDHGTDFLGDDFPKERLHRLEDGKHYGWPWLVGGDNRPNPIMAAVQGPDREEFRKSAERPVLEYSAHAAPMALVFYTGDRFPAEYRNDAFVAMRGSWNRKPAVGYEVVRIRFDDAGKPTRIEPFVTGFLVDDGKGFIARPTGLAQSRDGALLLSDDTNGVIYRIAYTGKE